MFSKVTGDLVYDIESYPNLFTLCMESVETGCQWQFEVSERKNDLVLLRFFIHTLAENNCRLAGYKNVDYDYPVLHYVLLSGCKNARDIYSKSQAVLKSNNKFGSIVKWDEVLVEQIDLFKIWHYDNFARSTSLKLLEFNMRMSSIEESKVPFDTEVSVHQIDDVIFYNKHDVKASVQFYWITRGSKDGKPVTPGSNDDKISFREELSDKYKKNMMNFNDTKIGKDYFIMELEKNKKGSCFYYENNQRKIRQTPRHIIPFEKLILPIVKFEDAEFQSFFERFRKITVTETKGSLKGIYHIHKGFRFDFGTGGIHGSIERELVIPAADEMIIDCDVTSLYPSLAIVNNFYPEHLGQPFCEIYAELFRQRNVVYNKKEYPTINLMLKLALNGVYGDSNSEYSPFYDPWMTMSITLNGQLLLCMLAEQLMKFGRILQINTDGVTMLIKKEHEAHYMSVIKWWESVTGLSMEYAYYAKMLIRDVNSYLALKTDGKVKEKGAYETQPDWHKNHSKLVVPKAVKGWFVNGTDLAETIHNHPEVMDFCLRTRLKGNHDRMHHGERRIGKVNRYIVSNSGEVLKKVMPPKGLPGQYKKANKVSDTYYEFVLNELREKWGTNEVFIKPERKEIIRKREKIIPQSYYIVVSGEEIETDITGLPFDPRINFKSRTKHEDVREQIFHQGNKTTIHNNIVTDPIRDINYNWYIQEAEKLIKGIIDEEETEDETEN